ncbi:MAG: hypothetical protein LBB87_00990 [Nitrososphaerota archaeon]|nr:hypothetical protein [Nitrososphaerota archaeon]
MVTENKKQKMLASVIISSILLLVVFANFSVAQSDEKSSLHLSSFKNNGYAAFNEINGQFTISAEASSNIVRVEFYLDDNLMLNATSTPYRWSFNTNDYDIGEHTLNVVGVTSSGETVTETRQYNFISFPTMFVIGIIVLIVVIFLVSIIIASKTRRIHHNKQPEY